MLNEKTLPSIDRTGYAHLPHFAPVFACMSPRNSAYIHNVDELIDTTRPWEAAAFYGSHWPEGKYSGNVRLPCPFNDSCNESSYGALSVNVDKQHSPILCHTCGTRGKLIELMWGFKHGKPFSGDRLRGEEFKEILTDLKTIRGQSAPPPDSPTPSPPVPSLAEKPAPEPSPVNIPLQDQEKTRGLVTLWEELIVDPAQMPPPAAAYFRKRPWLTPEVCRKWKMGYLPRDGRSLLRGLIVYAHQNAAGDILSYSGRDPAFEEKWQKWLRDGRPEKSRPNKHRYVKGFHKGIELYGAVAARLQDRRLKGSLGKQGLFVVEGQNDVIRLDTLGLPAVALCSNKATETQIAKLDQLARKASQSRLTLMPDNDEEGEAGFKDLLWHLASHGLDVRLAWSRTSHYGKFAGMQPEEMGEEELHEVLSRE